MNKRTIIAYILPVIWMAVIFVLSSQGHDVSSGQSMTVVQSVAHTTGVVLPEWVVRKGAHIVAYFILGALVYNAVYPHGLRRQTTATVSILVVVAYAISDEIHQLYVPGRSGELRDVLIDSVAGAVGVLLAQWLYYRYRLYKSQI